MNFPMILSTESFPEVDPLVLAYLAGVIDSDGYVSIQSSLHRGEYRYFGPRIGITGTRREPHDLASSIWGGKVYRYDPEKKSHRAQYQWSRSGRVAGVVIWMLYPYLRIKQEQARLAIELNNHLEMGRVPDPYPWAGPDYDGTERSRMLWQQVKELNQWRRA